MLNVDECVKLRESLLTFRRRKSELFHTGPAPWSFSPALIPAAVGLLSLVLMFALLPPNFYPCYNISLISLSFPVEFIPRTRLKSVGYAAAVLVCPLDGSALVVPAAKFHTHKVFIYSRFLLDYPSS